jgi:hypothetical protein
MRMLDSPIAVRALAALEADRPEGGLPAVEPKLIREETLQAIQDLRSDLTFEDLFGVSILGLLWRATPG